MRERQFVADLVSSQDLPKMFKVRRFHGPGLSRRIYRELYGDTCPRRVLQRKSGRV